MKIKLFTHFIYYFMELPLFDYRILDIKVVGQCFKNRKNPSKSLAFRHPSVFTQSFYKNTFQRLLKVIFYGFY